MPVEKRALRGGREGGSAAGRLTAPQPFVEQPRHRVRIDTGPAEPAARRVDRGGGEQQVLGIEIGLAAVHCLLRGDRDELAGPRTHQPVEVDPPYRTAGTTGARAGAEVAGKELVERAWL